MLVSRQAETCYNGCMEDSQLVKGQNPDDPQPSLPAPNSEEVQGTIETVPAVRVEHYGNGVIVRGPRGRMLPGTRSANQFTPESSRAAYELRMEKKRAAVDAGARAALAEVEQRVVAETENWMEAVAKRQAHLAMAGPDAYTTKAADWIARHSGQDERQQASESVVRHEYSVDPETADLIEQLYSRRVAMLSSAQQADEAETEREEN